MIKLKTKEEVKVIAEGGKRLAAILYSIADLVKPGVSTLDLEKRAQEGIAEVGGVPAFKDYHMGGDIYFPSALCVSINDEVVHGAALPERILQAGDIVDLDIGMEWPTTEEMRTSLSLVKNPHSKNGGFFSDTCITVPVGQVSKEAKKLLSVTRDCLYAGIKEAKVGNRMNDIARVIENLAKRHGFGVVRDFVGHGVGYRAHENPDVFHFTIPENSPENIKLKEGMVICIEPMINIGSEDIVIGDNEYTALTEDGSLSAHFEHSVYISSEGPQILTKYDK